MSFYPVMKLLGENLHPLDGGAGRGGGSIEPHVVCLGAVPCKWNQVSNREFYILLNILKFGYDAVKYQPGSCHHAGALRRRQGLDLMALFVFLM